MGVSSVHNSWFDLIVGRNIHDALRRVSCIPQCVQVIMS